MGTAGGFRVKDGPGILPLLILSVDFAMSRILRSFPKEKMRKGLCMRNTLHSNGFMPPKPTQKTMGTRKLIFLIGMSPFARYLVLFAPRLVRLPFSRLLWEILQQPMLGAGGSGHAGMHRSLTALIRHFSARPPRTPDAQPKPLGHFTTDSHRDCGRGAAFGCLSGSSFP